jgi:hypothetical protein
MSNNSVVCDDINDIHEFFWDGYEGKGEPYGLINLKLSKKDRASWRNSISLI